VNEVTGKTITMNSMKCKLVPLRTGLALMAVFLQSHLYAQQGTVKTDSLKEWLCKTWQIDYVLAEGMKITAKAGAPDIVFEFNPDNTYTLNPRQEKNSVHGKWKYDPEKKLILLFRNGKWTSRIISLIPEELVMLQEMKNATPDDPEDMKTVFKPKRD
jgi:hypothetical protein